ncbi:unnamed protein product [Peniophora sp. CBMAI 1063]|nr:unnamed protein product [Peniophora sp. CBMAI 1063]
MMHGPVLCVIALPNVSTLDFVSNPSVFRAPSMFNTVLICSGLGLAYALHLYLDYKRVMRLVRDFPGLRTICHPYSILHGISDKGFGNDPLFLGKYTFFENAGCEAISWINWWPRAKVSYVLADADAIKEVASDRFRYVKPSECYTTINVYGDNIVASEGEVWKRHRKITAPAFSEKQNQLVWDETCRVIDELIENIWKSAPRVDVQDAKEFTLPAAISVISAAGFGQRFSWQEDESVPEGHQMTFREALHSLCAGLIIVFAVPRWAMFLTSRLRVVRQSIDEVQKYMLEMIEERRYALDDKSRHDLFTLLMGNLEDGEEAATEHELMGNIFVFLLAGHETTAHTLAFALGFLALYPETQDRVFREIQAVTDDFQRELSLNDISSLTYTVAVFYETLRMLPAVISIPKRCTEDTSISVHNHSGDKTVIPIPAGTYVLLDAMGLHYNPRYWSDPHEFKPERFLEDWNKDAYLAFSAGVRGCMGRKFAETEAVAILTKIISRYSVKITETPDLVEASFEQRKARVMALKPGMTTTPAGIPLSFIRRV